MRARFAVSRWLTCHRALAGAVLLGLLLAPSAWVAWQTRDMPQFGHRGDDSIYFVCAKSLAQGHGYRILSLPDQPYQTKYPPLFPALLSVVWRLRPQFPENLPLAMLLAWLMAPVFLLLARAVFSELGIGRSAGWTLCGVLAVNPWVLMYSFSLMSELLFGSLVMGCLLLAARASRGQTGARAALLAGLVAGAAFLTRSSGLTLLCLAPALWLKGRRRQAALFSVGMLPAVVGWTLWVRAHQVATSDLNLLYHTDYIRFHLLNFAWQDVPLLVWKNLTSMFLALGGIQLMGIEALRWGQMPWVLVAGANIAGLVRLLRREGMFPWGWFLLGYAALLLVFHVLPGDSHERHLLPVAPLLLAGLWAELRRVAGVTWRLLTAARGLVWALGAGLAVVLGCLGVAALTSAVFLWRAPGALAEVRPAVAELRTASQWMVRNLPPDAALLWEYWDVTGYLYSGLKGRLMLVPPGLYYRNDREEALRRHGAAAGFMRHYHLGYAVISWHAPPGRSLDKEGIVHMRQVISTSPEFEEVFRVGKTVVYALKDGA